MFSEELYLFPQKIVFHNCDMFYAYRRQLIDYCYHLVETDSGKQYTIPKNGWQSSDLSLREDFNIFRSFLNWNIRKCMIKYGFDMSLIPRYNFDIIVMNLGYPGSYHNYHVHPGADISGVMWITAPENCGDLCFDNQNSFSQLHFIERLLMREIIDHCINSEYCIAPKEGQMILFPPNLAHHVLPNESGKDRISLVFNISF